MSDLVSRPYRPTQCCESCVFGRGAHAPWCPRHVTREEMEIWHEIEMLHEEIFRAGAD